MTEAGEVGRELQAQNAARDFNNFGGGVFLFFREVGLVRGELLAAMLLLKLID